MGTPVYELCGQPKCPHFIVENDCYELDKTLAPYIHLDDGEKEHDHDAFPSFIIYTLEEWRVMWPELFETYSDGKIGPNSSQFKYPGD